jgi:hypothetical protein
LRNLGWGAVGAMVFGQAFPVAAASVAGTSVQKINGIIESSDFTSVDEPNYSVEIATLFHGLASSGASTGPGAISSQSLVSIDLPALVAAAGVGGTWRARSQANLIETIQFGTDWCSPSLCLEALDIGIEYVEITFHVHASGGVTSFVSDTQFGISDAAVTLDYQLQSSRAVALMTQTKRSIRQSSQELDEGFINSASATLELRPGDQLELKMNATTFAELHVPAQPVNDPKPSLGTAMADFAHTLKWEGVTDIRAFDINGDEVALAPGGRFTMLGESTGHDYWFPSPGVDRKLPNPDGSEASEGGAGGADDGGSAGAGEGGSVGGNDDVGAGGTFSGSAGSGEGGSASASGATTAQGDGGASDTGGANEGGASSTDSSGRNSARLETDDDGGCGCRTPSKASTAHLGPIVALLGALSLLRRRRGGRANRQRELNR